MSAPNSQLGKSETAKRLPLAEFTVLMAVNFALVAFSIDAMLPALPAIAQELSPDAVNNAQLVITSFVLGMGIGTLFTGPLSDAFGRRRIFFWGVALFIIGTALAGLAESLETHLAARIVQGLGVAGPRIVLIAMIRDLYAGRNMARIMSLVMLVFTLVPAVAPLCGAIIIDMFGWRMIYLAFVIFALFTSLWLAFRQGETHPVRLRTPFRPLSLLGAARACFRERVFRLSTAAQSLSFAMLFANLSSVHPIFENVYGMTDEFPYWFALIAVLGGIASILNASLVMRLGMRKLVLIGFWGQALLSGLVLIVELQGMPPFMLFMIWTTSIFFTAGLVIGNLNSLALEPLGHVAGMAASIIGSVSTVVSVLLAVPLGLAFNGTLVPMSAGILLYACVAALITGRIERSGDPAT